jgi:hypothetical protein
MKFIGREYIAQGLNESFASIHNYVYFTLRANSWYEKWEKSGNEAQYNRGKFYDSLAVIAMSAINDNDTARNIAIRTYTAHVTNGNKVNDLFVNDYSKAGLYLSPVDFTCYDFATRANEYDDDILEAHNFII